MTMRFKLKLSGKINRYAFLLLISLIGLIFSIIPISYETSFNIFIPGIFLLTLPIIYLLIWMDNSLSRDDEIFIFLLIILSILYNHFIFSLRFDYPIGTDAPVTLSVTRSFLTDTGKIIFFNIRSASSGFPGMYIFYTILSEISGTNLNILAIYLPPTLNMGVFVFFYFLIRKYFDARLSLLALFLSGWEFTVIKFGFEYRTQSLAIVIYMGILALLSLRSKENIFAHNNSGSNNTESKIVLLYLIFVAALTITHIVTMWVLIITLIGIYLSFLIAQNIEWKLDLKSSLTLVLISSIMYIAYMMFVGQFFDGIIRFFTSSVEESFASEPLGPSSKAQGLVADLYGPFVFWVTWLIRSVFLISGILFIKLQLVKQKRASDLFILSWLCFLLFFIFVIAIQGFELNPGRLYNFFAFPFSVIVSFGLYYIIGIRNMLPKTTVKLVISIFLILYIITSLLKFQTGIIGDTYPFRGYQGIDDVRWW